MKPDQKTIKALIKGIEKYNHAKTAEEGFGALNNLIKIGEKELRKVSREH
jgi:hypothetical protein